MEETDELTLPRGFETLADQVEKLGVMAANPRQRVPWGMRSLDLITGGGVAAGEVFTVIGRSHTGKSMVATNIMLHNENTPLIFFSLEMPSHQVVRRLWSHVSGSDGRLVNRQLANNALPLDELRVMAKRFDQHVVVDKSGTSLPDMSRYVELYEMEYGYRPAAVIIDYLEEVGGGKQSGDGWVRTEATASAVKSWAKNEGIGVYLLHQVSMSKYQQWEEPLADAPKGGGYTEADVMVGIWRPDFNPDPPEHYPNGTFFMNVIKNRVTGQMTKPGGHIRMQMDSAGFLEDVNYPYIVSAYGD